ncbi:hypothetical protein [Mesorhizobium sp. M1C.F.Ca.ET.176.01.1.1]|nr:hypothetical protein [Mesorhizobium sp. M1C.F.Ca.ET.176.01.1.1]
MSEKRRLNGAGGWTDGSSGHVRLRSDADVVRERSLLVQRALPGYVVE